MTNRSTLERALTMRMAPTARAWQQLADSALATLGLSESHARAVAYLSILGSDTRQGDLARAIGVAEASLVRTLQHLERSGVILRVPDEEDRRANCLRLTEAGEAMAKSINTRLADLRSQLFRGLDDEQLTAAGRLLDTMAERIAHLRIQP